VTALLGLVILDASPWEQEAMMKAEATNQRPFRK
jgi:hypothetical protein